MELHPAPYFTFKLSTKFAPQSSIQNSTELLLLNQLESKLNFHLLVQHWDFAGSSMKHSLQISLRCLQVYRVNLILGFSSCLLEGSFAVIRQLTFCLLLNSSASPEHCHLLQSPSPHPTKYLHSISKLLTSKPFLGPFPPPSSTYS